MRLVSSRLLFFSLRPVTARPISAFAFPKTFACNMSISAAVPNGANGQQKSNNNGDKKEVKILMLHGKLPV